MKNLLPFLTLAVCILTSCSKNDQTPVDKSLVIYLPQNKNTKDLSSYHASGIVDSASFTVDRNGKANYASLFDSVKTYIRIPNSTLLDTMTSVTLAAWILPNSWAGTGSNAIISKEYSSGFFTYPYYQYHIGITGNKYSHAVGTVLFSLAINNAYVYASTDQNAWTPGTWVHIAGTYDGTDVKVYVNGELKNTVNAPGAMGHFGQDVFVGKLGSTTTKPSNTPGSFDEIRIYNRALTADEIHSLYTQK